MYSKDVAVINWLASSMRTLQTRVHELEKLNQAQQTIRISLFAALFDSREDDDAGGDDEDGIDEIAGVEEFVEYPAEVNKEVIKVVPVVAIKEVEKEFIKEVSVEVIKDVEKVVEVIKEAPFEMIKKVENVVEVIKEVPVQKIKEVEKIGEMVMENAANEEEKVQEMPVHVPLTQEEMEVPQSELKVSEFPPSAHQIYVAHCLETYCKNNSISIYNRNLNMDLGLFAREVSTGWSGLGAERSGFEAFAELVHASWQCEQRGWLKRNSPSVFIAIDS